MNSLNHLLDINTVARHIVGNATVNVPPEWEDFPEIGEDDWKLVCDEVVRIANNFRPPLYSVKLAMQRLTERADTEG